MRAVEILDSPGRAGVLLDETRLRLVRELGAPDSAAGVARRLGLPRQRVNYHLRELEKAGFVELVEERRKGNCTERVVKATAAAFVVGPDCLGDLGPDPKTIRDRFSLGYLVATASRIIRDLGRIGVRAARAGQPVSTLTIQADVRFATPADRGAFAEDLTTELAALVREYHDDTSTDGRVYRVVVGAYPAITRDESGRELSPDEADLSPGDVR